MTWLKLAPRLPSAISLCPHALRRTVISTPGLDETGSAFVPLASTKSPCAQPKRAKGPNEYSGDHGRSTTAHCNYNRHAAGLPAAPAPPPTLYPSTAATRANSRSFRSWLQAPHGHTASGVHVPVHSWERGTACWVWTSCGCRTPSQASVEKRGLAIGVCRGQAALQMPKRHRAGAGRLSSGSTCPCRRGARPKLRARCPGHCGTSGRQGGGL